MFRALIPLMDQAEEGGVVNGRFSAGLTLFTLIAFARGPPSQDPDYQYLFTHAKPALYQGESGTNSFCQQLARLALDRPPNRKDKSCKATYLKYVKWLAQGAKVETCPIAGRPPGYPSNTRLTALISSKTCAACGKSGASMRCPNCSFKDDKLIVAKTAYCNKQCLENHHDAHKSVCEGRVQIYRAAQLLEYISIALEEGTYIFHPRQVYEKDGILFAVEADWDREGMTGRPLFLPLSKRLGNSAEDHRALLSWGRSVEPIDDLGQMVQHIFKPICKSITVATIRLRNATRPVCGLRGARTMNCCLCKHPVLKLRLKSDEVYVVDLTGAQFGWMEVLAPWEAWRDLRVARADGQAPKYRQPNAHPKRPFPGDNELEACRQLARVAILSSMMEEVGRLAITKALRGPLDDFKSTERAFQRAIHQCVDKVVEGKYHKPYYRLCPGTGTGARIELVKHRYKDYQGVWLSAREFDRLQGAGEDMKKIWKERLHKKCKETGKECPTCVSETSMSSQD
ncbi:hypothetical protein F4802DRAFT_609538 [Xylaria palmicola]|nr:hypothetical protein F4802DRAFT_609538 [Xylaria palmicola]